MHTAPNYYAQVILAATTAKGATESDIDQIYDMMHTVSHGASYSGMTKTQLNKLCRTAWETVQFMRTPEGIAMCAQIEAEMFA